MKSINRLFTILALMLFFSVSAFAVDNTATTSVPPTQQEVVVHIKQDAPVADPSAAKTTVQKADEWVMFGEHLGKAFDAGLTSLSDHAEKFSKTDAGRFTMAVIAWKVAGADAINLMHHFTNLIAGTVLALVVLFLYIWYVRRFCCVYSVKKSMTGPFWNRVITYETMVPGTDSDRAGCMIFGTIVAFIFMFLIVANLIT